MSMHCPVLRLGSRRSEATRIYQTLGVHCQILAGTRGRLFTPLRETAIAMQPRSVTRSQFNGLKERALMGVFSISETTCANQTYLQSGSTISISIEASGLCQALG